MKIAAFIASSMDGFIATKEGGIDWLMEASDPNDSEDYGYAAFTDTISCLVMGRNTFDKVMSFPEWPYAGKRVVVLSHSLSTLPDALQGKVELFAGEISDLVEQLRGEGECGLYIDGGKVIQSFIREGLLQEIIVTRIPVLLGEGVPLFGSLDMRVQLNHLTTRSYPSGFVQSHYQLLSRK